MAERPETVQQLIEWFESEFSCMVGPAKAYFEIPIGPGFQYNGHDEAIYRCVYESYVVKCRDIVDSEKLLVGAMYDDFKAVPRQESMNTLLFWRLPEKIELKSVLNQLYGACLVNAEEIENGAPVPKMAVSDLTGNYYENAGTERIWKLRTRLRIPGMCHNNHPPMMTLKAEGAEALLIGEQPNG